ncbi:unnamed protein product [Effrenium voratum]|uniref:CBS domain-containing protein n=1 Tax=Effrenium voratum TaxID=2562239 RepID=A0AA36JFD1_9DINO|nr:unnamed protein product [Effrenium voratum]
MTTRGFDVTGEAKMPACDMSTAPGTPEEFEDAHMEGLTVGELARQIGALPPCATHLSLREAAQRLLSTGQAAGCVVNESGVPVGVITEDDILHSYVQGAPWDTTVGEWVRGGGGVLFDPSPADGSVVSEQPLHSALPALVAPRVVPRMGRMGGRSALLVERRPGYEGGVLSAQDVVRGLARRAASESLRTSLGLGPTVADIMEPVERAPRLRVGFTMRELLQELLASPLRAALVLDCDGTIGGLATVADALWAFNQQMSQTLDAWDRLSSRPGRVDRQNIAADAAVPNACSALEGARHLLATERGDVVGVVSPAHLVSARCRARPVPSAAPYIELQRQERPRKVKEEEGAVKRQEDVKLEEPAPKKRAVMVKPKVVTEDEPQAVTLADVVARRETAHCSVSDTLSDAVDQLVCTGRTAAVVLDGDQIQGVLTENDVLAALVEGTTWNCKIGDWLKGSFARLPGFLVPALTLPSSASVADAAAEMVTLVEDGLGFACHHLLVHAKEEGEAHVRVLSALDIARGMVETVTQAGAAGGISALSAQEAAQLTVEQAMKERRFVSTCKLGDSLLKAFEEMHASKQNCVLILDDGHELDEEEKTEVKQEDEEREELTAEDEQWNKEHGQVLGTVTSSDALRAFSEHLRGNTSSVRGWLRGLNEQEHHSPAARSVRCNATLAEAALEMCQGELHHLLVMDGDGEVAGVLSALDIVCALGASYRFDLASPRFV